MPPADVMTFSIYFNCKVSLVMKQLPRDLVYFPVGDGKVGTALFSPWLSKPLGCPVLGRQEPGLLGAGGGVCGVCLPSPES